MEIIEINHRNKDNFFGVLVLFGLLIVLIYVIDIPYELIKELFETIFFDIKISLESIIFSSVIVFIYFLLMITVLRKLYIGIVYFNSIEKCYVENNNFNYERKLEIFNLYTLNLSKKIINISDIKNITLIPYKKSMGFSTNFIPFWYIYFFACKNRIAIETSNGQKIEIWNFKKYPNFFNEEKDIDKKNIENYFNRIKKMIE